MNRLVFDTEEDQWKFQPLVPAENKFTQMKRRPTSAVGYKRPISQFARVAIAMGAHSRYRAENIMILELDMTPPTLFQMDFPKANTEAEPSRDVLLDNASYREKTAANRVRKSRSWTPTGPPQSRWTVRDDSSSAAAQCSVGHPLVLHQWAQDAAPQDTAPTGRCPTGHCPYRTLLEVAVSAGTKPSGPFPPQAPPSLWHPQGPTACHTPTAPPLQQQPSNETPGKCTPPMSDDRGSVVLPTPSPIPNFFFFFFVGKL
ncbi:hypothetical protein NFI96_026665 [Prochilodus magdalenae]|nr:hypothetical protein NFI96_026665 [Prochilodus magdalenae]